MKQYKITAETFRLEGDDPTLPDSYIDPQELARVKKLAGIDQLGLMERMNDRSGESSPVDGHIGTEKGEYQRKHNIRPGSDEWFKLWFARPQLTGENPMPKK
jgi:hypothetical protein